MTSIINSPGAINDIKNIIKNNVQNILIVWDIDGVVLR